MATTIPGWIPKLINQVVAYRERQQVTHERLNELFNLLIVQGDFNTETLETLNANLAAFDLQYIADMGVNTVAHQNLLDNFTTAVNQMKADNTAAISNLDTQQRALMAQLVIDFEADLAETELSINTELTTKLAAIQVLHDGMLAKEAEFDADMTALTTTVDNLSAAILADNQAIAAQIQADRLAIENLVSVSGQIMEDAEQVYAAIDQSRTYKKAGGTSTALTLTLNSVTAYYAGMAVHAIALADNAGAATTLKVDALSALPVYKLGTTTAPNIVLGKPYTFVVSEDLSHFFLVASAEGNAIAEHVLAPNTFSNDNDTAIIGTMPNVGAVNQSLALNASYAIPAGYHNGSGQVFQALPASVVDTADANATASKILAGSSGYVNGVKVNGSIPSFDTTQDLTAYGVASGVVKVVPPTGYHHGYALNVVDEDFAAPNFLATKNMFGLQGSIPVVTGGNVPAAGATYYQVDGILLVPTAGTYFKDSGIYANDPDFIAANIKKDVNIFGKVGTLIEGKKFASGTVVGNIFNNMAVLKSEDGASQSGNYNYFAEVSGLSFRPSKIIMTCFFGTSTHMCLYMSDSDGYQTEQVKMFAVNISSGNLVSLSFYANYGYPYVNSTGFRLPVQLGGNTYTWYAYE